MLRNSIRAGKVVCPSCDEFSSHLEIGRGVDWDKAEDEILNDHFKESPKCGIYDRRKKLDNRKIRKKIEQEDENGDIREYSLTRSEMKAYKRLISLGYKIKRQTKGADFIIEGYIDTPIEIKDRVLSEKQQEQFIKSNNGMLVIVTKNKLMIFELKRICDIEEKSGKFV